ncbi:MAG: endolytic transglycosylase MltG [Flavobacteriales bacterium]
MNVNSTKLSSRTRWTIIIGAALMAIIGVMGYWTLYASNTTRTEIVLVREDMSVTQWLNENQGLVNSRSSFKAAALMKRLHHVKPGRFSVEVGMSNRALIDMLRSGRQSPISLRIDDVKTMEELAGKLGRNLQFDSTAFIKHFYNDSLLQQWKCTAEQLPCFIPPNTYEFYWTISPREFTTRMKGEHDKFWSAERLSQAEATGLSPMEVTILASIVKAECARNEEAPIIAGLYMNRLRIGMRLQSDPTAVFGSKHHIQRVTESALNNDTPYNTYLHDGLPPGPINFPEQVYLKAVLDAQKHDFVFMCAEAKGTGRHLFATTLGEHEKNRRAYIEWLNATGIR